MLYIFHNDIPNEAPLNRSMDWLHTPGTGSVHLSPVQFQEKGGGGGAKVLGKVSVLGHPTYFDNSRARAYCACSRCGWAWFGHFFSRLSFLFSISPSLGDGPI